MKLTALILTTYYFVAFFCTQIVYAKGNDSLKFQKKSFELGIVTSTLPKGMSSFNKIPDEKYYFGYGLIIGKNWKLNNKFQIETAFSIVKGKESFTFYYSYYDSLFTLHTNYSHDYSSYLLNSVIISLGYNYNSCNEKQNLFFNVGIAINHKKIKNTKYLNFTFDNYFDRFFSERYLNISPVISIKYERKFYKTFLFIKNEVYLHGSDYSFGLYKTGFIYNRLIFGIKI